MTDEGKEGMRCLGDRHGLWGRHDGAIRPARFDRQLSTRIRVAVRYFIRTPHIASCTLHHLDLKTESHRSIVRYEVELLYTNTSIQSQNKQPNPILPNPNSVPTSVQSPLVPLYPLQSSNLPICISNHPLSQDLEPLPKHPPPPPQ
jgi:hypothetical protein